MSGSLLPILTGFGAAGVDGLVSVLFRPARRIGFLVPDVVVNEHHVDTLSITRHPVQQGANISDHAYKEPAMVTIQAAYSGSSYSALFSLATGADIVGSLTDGQLGESYVQQVYTNLLALQQDRELLEVITGKRAYNNMLIASVEVHTDKESEYTLMLRITCQQVIIVNSSTATLPARSLQRFAPSTGPIAPTGQIAPVTPSGASSARGLGGLFRSLTQ